MLDLVFTWWPVLVALEIMAATALVVLASVGRVGPVGFARALACFALVTLIPLLAANIGMVQYVGREPWQGPAQATVLSLLSALAIGLLSFCAWLTSLGAAVSAGHRLRAAIFMALFIPPFVLAVATSPFGSQFAAARQLLQWESRLPGPWHVAAAFLFAGLPAIVAAICSLLLPASNRGRDGVRSPDGARPVGTRTKAHAAFDRCLSSFLIVVAAVPAVYVLATPDLDGTLGLLLILGLVVGIPGALALAIWGLIASIAWRQANGRGGVNSLGIVLASLGVCRRLGSVRLCGLCRVCRPGWSRLNLAVWARCRSGQGSPLGRTATGRPPCPRRLDGRGDVEVQQLLIEAEAVAQRADRVGAV